MVNGVATCYVTLIDKEPTYTRTILTVNGTETDQYISRVVHWMTVCSKQKIATSKTQFERVIN
jgi:hypothetical protein